MPEREIDPGVLEDRLDELRRDVTLLVPAPPVDLLSRRAQARTLRRAAFGGVAAAAVVAGVLAVLPRGATPVEPPTAAAVPVAAFLTPHDAKAALGSYLGPRGWSPSARPRLLFPHRAGCAPGLPAPRTRALVQGNGPSAPVLRTAITVAADPRAAGALAATAQRSAAACAGRELGAPVRATRPGGRAVVVGASVGDVMDAKVVEYVVVARAGRAVEVANLRFGCQEFPQPAVLRALADAVLGRLRNAG
ncbi:MAG: hypothetical protein ACXVXM_02500 [Nocardioidaceae bacterium]